MLMHRAILLGYWLRPYDSHLDARRWRWAKSGCRQSREWWVEHGKRLIRPVEKEPATVVIHTEAPCEERA